MSGFLTQQWIVALALNGAIAAVGLLSEQKALTRSGTIHAAILGAILWGCLGWPGYAIVAVYFILGTAATKVGMAQKEAQGIAEKRGGARGPENVWGSALTGAVCAIAFAFWPNPLWKLGFAASFAAKLADTASSEVGKAYGKRTFLITSFKPVPPGSEGAISLEGTLAGWIAAGVLTGLAAVLQVVPPNWWWVCWGAAVLATTIESWMGATIQPLFDWLTNEAINGIQTAIAAAIAILGVVLLRTQGFNF
ncbi:TIGR00297 family protein [Synechococcus sp. PCC 7336]|uniref:TIGR00297 family protein n=1 Tax=Synechococcus sp. PCC 7336 TaxID=195250 RepID=UPI0003495317|nr:TIGR00297 family protein [Synechococcus sp. PCC 7336]